jgi:hypothetical protein
MEYKPEPIEFYGILALQRMLHCGTPVLHRRLGPPDGTLRYGCHDAPIWLAERALDVPFREIPNMTWYTANEGARYVGVTRNTFKRIMPGPLGCVVSGNLWSKRSNMPIWTDAQCYAARRRIKEGAIKVSWRSLTRPLLGVTIAEPRHCLVERQGDESEACRKAHRWARLAV